MLRYLIPVLLFCPFAAFATNDKSGGRQEYISTWKNEAVYQMVVHKIPASITLAQGILESGDGNSRLAREGNNHFGIKCHSDWKGKTIHEDDETRGECFRRYDNARDSYEDHSAFLQRKRYEPLFKLDADDYKGWARGLKQCGYATNPKYPDLLIGIIEEFKLHVYDKEALEYIRKNKIPARTGITPMPVEKPEEIATTPVTKNKKDRNRNKTRNDDERTEITISNTREIHKSDNNIKYTLAKSGETLASIATDLDINEWLLRRYNDMDEAGKVKEGQVIYTQPKRSKGRASTHIVKKGESMWEISQVYGIKLKKLQALNGIGDGVPLKSGQEIKLRK